MPVQTVGCRKNKDQQGNDIAIRLEIDGELYEVTYANLASVNANTATKIEARVVNWADTNGINLPEFHIHINEDNSIAIAIGPEPDVWPEDEVE